MSLIAKTYWAGMLFDANDDTDTAREEMDRVVAWSEERLR